MKTNLIANLILIFAPFLASGDEGWNMGTPCIPPPGWYIPRSPPTRAITYQDASAHVSGGSPPVYGVYAFDTAAA